MGFVTFSLGQCSRKKLAAAATPIKTTINGKNIEGRRCGTPTTLPQ
jgi:hypothetical protein